MARTFLNPGEIYSAGPSRSTLIGVVGVPTKINLPGDARTTFDSSFASGGATIKIDGSPEQYTAGRDGSNLRLISERLGTDILIPAGVVGAAVLFSDGNTRILRISDGRFLLGDQDFTVEVVQVKNYENYHLNSIANNNISIDARGSNDLVNTWGETAVRINTGAGNDTVYTDNSGTSDISFNSGRATWVFNSATEEVTNLLGQNAVRITNVANITLEVNFQGVMVNVVVARSNEDSPIGYSLTEMDITQAIKEAVNTTVLANFLTAENGPGGTLLVKSDIDGQVDVSDFSIRLINTPGATLSLSQIGQGVRNLSGLNSDELAAIGFSSVIDGVSSPIGDGLRGERFASEFGTDGLLLLNGEDSSALNNNRVYGGPGNDNIVLSSHDFSVEHIVFKRDELFDDDTILNFTAAAEVESRSMVTFNSERVIVGYDIFDLSSILGVSGPLAKDFVNDNISDAFVDDHELQQLNNMNFTRQSLVLIDNVEAGDPGTTAAATTELARLQQLLTIADDTAHLSDTVYSVVITVNDATNVGAFYQVANGTAEQDAVVTLLGTVQLGFYELDGKEAIGNWGQMTVDNFTSLTPTELINVYGSSFGF